MPNPKLPRVPTDKLPADILAAREQSMALRGDATFFDVFGNNPELYRWYVNRFYGEVFHRGRVDRQSKELLRYRLSTTHGCRFCNQGNRRDAEHAGIAAEVLDAIEQGETERLGAREQAVLDLADRIALTNPGGHLDEATHAALARHYSDAEILELGMVAGVLTGMAKFLFAFDLVEREDGCPVPTPGN